jgi:cell fate regulator YaaT (PSP1 superfamily)
MKVVGVQFNSAVKIYDFVPGRHKVVLTDWVVVETTQGVEIGRVVYINKEITDKEGDDIKEIIRLAEDKDLSRYERMCTEGAEYFDKFRKIVMKSGLDMKPVKSEFSFDGERVVFYFTAESRVDFRDLIKDLSREAGKQVIMRQIGPRDEAKMLGGNGVCGQEICCKRFMTAMTSVTMDMARDQFENNVNANKVTGACGRLMCCLAFEVGNKPKVRKR